MNELENRSFLARIKPQSFSILLTLSLLTSACALLNPAGNAVPTPAAVAGVPSATATQPPPTATEAAAEAVTTATATVTAMPVAVRATPIDLSSVDPPLPHVDELLFVPSPVAPIPSRTRRPLPTATSAPAGDGSGDAQPTSTATATTAASTAWQADYFGNQSLSGNPALTREDSSINFSWGQGSPASNIPNDGFSARWQRSADFESAIYRFRVNSDDGVRVWIDSLLIVDEWHNAEGVEYEVDVAVGGGRHLMRVEYYEDEGDAQIQVSWAKTSAASEWRGEYFDNRDLSGSPEFTRDDDDIDFDWGSGSPDNRISNDDFSIRWTRSFDFDAGTYRLRVRNLDDGARVRIDGNQVINEWHSNDGVTYEVDVDLDGLHVIVVEYYEASGGASIEFDYFLR